MFRTIFRNIAFNWLGFSIQAITTFVLTPIVVSRLGEAQYGVWAAITGLTGYYGIVDLGLRGGTTQFLTRYLAQRDFVRLNQSFNSALATLCGIAVAVVVLSGILGWSVPHSFNLPDGISTHTATLCILTIGLGVASQFAFFPYSALFVATQRYDLSNVIGILMRVVAAVGTYVAVDRGYGLFTLSLVNCLTNLCEYTIRCIVGKRLVPEIRLAAADIKFERIREFLSYGLWNSVGSVSYALREGTDLIIVMFIYGEIGAAVSRYKLGAQLSKYLGDLMGTMTMVFFPSATALHARNDRNGLVSLWFQGTRMVLLVLACLSVIGWQWANDFYRIWVGESLTDASLPTAADIFRVLLLTTIAGFAGGVGRQILMGCILVRITSLLTVMESIGVVALSSILGYFFQIRGVAWGALIAVVIVRVILEPTMVAHQLQVSIGRYWLQTAARPILVAIPLYFLTGMLRAAFPAAQHYWQLAVQGLLAGGIAAILVSLVGIDASERLRVFRGVHRRLGLSRAQAQ